MSRIIPTEIKEQLIDMTSSAVRSGLANGDYQNIDIKIKNVMRDYLVGESDQAQIYILTEFINYMLNRIVVPGSRLGMVGLINVGRMRGVPKFLLDCATAIWGTLFSSKPNPAKLRDLLLSRY